MGNWCRGRLWVSLGSSVILSTSIVACSGDGDGSGTSQGGSAGRGSGGAASGASNGGSSSGGTSTGGVSANGGQVQGTTGDPCTSNSDCVGKDNDGATCITTWPGGYCSAPCALYLECSGNTDDAACESVEGQKRCLEACASDSACRSGYRCNLDIFACVPK